MAERKERPCERSLSSSTSSSAPKWVLFCRRYLDRRNIAYLRSASISTYLMSWFIAVFRLSPVSKYLCLWFITSFPRIQIFYYYSLLVESIIWFNNILFKFYAILFLFLGMLMSIYSQSLHKNISSFSLYFF